MKNKVEVEQPKAEVSQVAVEPVAAVTPVNSRFYRLIAEPSISPRGKQRIIVLQILREHKEGITPEQMKPLADALGLVATGGVLPSCRYHLHQLKLQGLVEESNKSWTAQTEAA